MLKENTRSRRQAREARLPLVAEYYKRGYSIRKIREEVNARLDMSVSVPTIHKDIKYLLAEWRSLRIANTDDMVSLELERIDQCLVELWDQWEKSKENYMKDRNKRVGIPVPKDKDKDGNTGSGENTEIVTVKRENSTENVVALGNPAYMAEIRQQLIERRKLLGLYENRLDITSGGQPLNQRFQIEVITKPEEVEESTDNTGI